MDSPPPTQPASTPESDPLSALLASLRAGARSLSVTGLKGAARGHVLAQLSRAGAGPFVCVVADEEKADALATDLRFFWGAGTSALPSVLRLPGDAQLPYDLLSPDRAAMFERLATLFHLSHETRSRALVVSARALARRYLPLAVLEAHSERVAENQELDRDRLAKKLVAMGYQSAPVVEDVGTFAVRGSILDVWSPLEEKPARIEYFGDTVETLRRFDPESQRTAGKLESLLLCPAREVLFDASTKAAGIEAVREAADAVNRPSSKVRELLDAVQEEHLVFGMEALLPGFFGRRLAPLFEYLAKWAKDPLVFVDDPLSIEGVLQALDEELAREFEAARAREELAMEPGAHFLCPEEIDAGLAARRRLESHAVHLGGPAQTTLAFAHGATSALRQEIANHHGEHGALSPLVSRLLAWRDASVFAAVACGGSGQADRLKRLLLDRELMVKVRAEPFPAEPAKAYEPAVHAHLYPGEISAGFVDAPNAVALLAEEDIFGQKSRKAVRRTRADLPFVTAFRDLKDGDLVVHVDYGIGRYAGLSKMVIRGVSGDVLVLEYAGKDKVYLPVARLRLLQKFTGSGAENIALDRLGSGSWEKRKKAVKEHLLKMAAELLNIYAARKAHPGHAFKAPDDYFRQFEADFPFEETQDQAKAIVDVLEDMTSPRPMDRLVCGDVGYGKTEVAVRAAFKAVLDKKQVAVLVPTTVLAAQHLRTFRERFRDYAVNVEMVSRMHSARDNRAVLERAAQGQVDVLIGTHRLLGSDVSFKDLGLVVIDEEQRFGVAHKEKLKKYRSQVDVLTLTATPIPRTLHLSMSGMRDMSIIATPPEDRKAIRTFVIKFDPVQIAEAIRREIARGGQVYFVHNRVQSIRGMVDFLKEQVPEARLAIAHGQMGEGELEKVMTEFIERQHDVLVCSSIIESGLDIPSANTIIVNRADTFGLAQLYQIRGRVGRSRERAWAYLLVPAKKPMTKDAGRRLEVLQSFTELGAGFSIASHDLEIRGAGNLLGPDQSGQIAAVGFDLYAQLLDEAVRELKGEPPPSLIDPDVILPVPAYIPDDYVPDIQLRLNLYKRFSQVQGDDELSDLRGEMQDRFGDIPLEVDNLSEVMAIKADMRRLRLRTLESGPGRIVFSLGHEAELDPQKLTGLVQRSKGAYRLTPEMKLVATSGPKTKEPQDVLGACKRVLRDLLKCQSERYLKVEGIGPKLRR
jgi:transcription-repair coupling factor (superfamily II helicase)